MKIAPKTKLLAGGTIAFALGAASVSLVRQPPPGPPRLAEVGQISQIIGDTSAAHFTTPDGGWRYRFRVPGDPAPWNLAKFRDEGFVVSGAAYEFKLSRSADPAGPGSTFQLAAGGDSLVLNCSTGGRWYVFARDLGGGEWSGGYGFDWMPCARDTCVSTLPRFEASTSTGPVFRMQFGRILRPFPDGEIHYVYRNRGQNFAVASGRRWRMRFSALNPDFGFWQAWSGTVVLLGPPCPGVSP